VIYVLYTVHIVVSLFLIMVVLLQQGKGADLSVFGGGGTQAAFGARGAATLLHKLTVWGFVTFVVTTMSIGFMTTRQGRSSVMATAAEEVPVAAEEATTETSVETEAAVDEAAPPAEIVTEESIAPTESVYEAAPVAEDSESPPSQ